MIDTTFDFRSDSKGKDPDAYSPTLNAYCRALWSKELPNGEVIELQSGRAPYAFKWKDFWFSSDTIIVEMTHLKNKKIIDQVREQYIDFDAWCEHLRIADRLDLTLEFIRRHYAGEESPLSKVIEGDKAFYDLFVDFKGYVDFFLMQDCVSEDYSYVDIWMGDASFEKNGLPETVEDYFKFLVREHIFLDKRNARIQEYCINHNLV